MGDKFYKYKEKYNEGKLKGNKLELYEDYLYNTKKLDEKTIEVGEKRIERNKVEQKLKSEKNKSQYFHRIKDVYQYSNGLCSLHKEYNKYEKLVLEEELKDGVRNGSYKRYENGTVKEEGTYLNNKKNGLWTLHSYNGKEVYNYSNDTKEGEYKEYSGDVVVKEGQYSNGLMTGEWIFRYDSGNLRGQGNYINGDGGNLSESGFPINGRDGLWKWNYENGKIRYTTNYSNGKREGEYLSYYENGSIELVGSYVNGCTSSAIFELFNSKNKIEFCLI
jgi:antitoxin component YwqK of YwqJK toxin-antitoxin module